MESGGRTKRNAVPVRWASAATQSALREEEALTGDENLLLHALSRRMLTNFADFATEQRMFLSAIYEHRDDSLFGANYRVSNCKLRA